MSYEDGFIHRCRVERDPGGAKGERGAPEPAYAVVSGLESVPCRLTTPRAAEAWRAAQRVARLTHRVFFASGMRLTNADRLVFVDAVTAEDRVLSVLGASDPDGLGQMYVASCEEQEEG